MHGYEMLRRLVERDAAVAPALNCVALDYLLATAQADIA